jgi:phosphoacetylglucosamine mutase
MTTPAGIDAAIAQTDGLPLDLIEEGCKEYPKPEGIVFTYGTAGIRTK